MSRTVTRLLAAAVLNVLMPASALAAPSPNRPTADQGAMVFMDNCPYPPVPLPSVDTECTAIEVFTFRHWEPVTGPDPWAAFAEIQDVVIHPDGTFDVLGVVNGIDWAAAVTYDPRQLSATSLVATVPMSDGSALSVHLDWTADEKINEGTAPYWTMPANLHLPGDCTVTTWRNVRPKIRHSTVSGTIGTTSIGDLVEDGYTVWNSESFDNLVVFANLGKCP